MLLEQIIFEDVLDLTLTNTVDKTVETGRRMKIIKLEIFFKNLERELAVRKQWQ